MMHALESEAEIREREKARAKKKLGGGRKGVEGFLNEADVKKWQMVNYFEQPVELRHTMLGVLLHPAVFEEMITQAEKVAVKAQDKQKLLNKQTEQETEIRKRRKKAEKWHKWKARESGSCKR
jgi:hypothetical protein